MTIYVEDLREEIKRIPNPVVYADELTELLDAYEERDRLRAALLHIEGAISLSRPSLFNQSLSVIARAALEGRE